MPTPDVKEAQIWARDFLKARATRLPELMGRTGDLSYPVEILREGLGITQDAETGAWEVPYIAIYSLLDASRKETAAFDLIKSIIADNLAAIGSIPDGWKTIAAEIVRGTAKRPVKGRQSKNGVRDLIFLVMAKSLSGVYGLPVGKNDATQNHGNLPSACDVIYREMRAIGFPQQSPAAIKKAIRRIME